ncbi:Receptor expression-enhancing protein 2, partial [Frankliniella fusca]
SYQLLYSACRLLFGTLYPAYASYKAVRTKDVREYVKWMMYWIVFALFTCAETFTDVLLSFWFPFYYELKIIVVLWLLAPATKGSSIIYRKFVHPTFTKKEKEIDEAIKNAKDQGYSTILKLGARGVDYAKYILMQTAIKGLENTAVLATLPPNGPETSARTDVGREYVNGHGPHVSNGFFQLGADHVDGFQYSDDDEAEYIPSAMKEEPQEREEELVEEERAPRTRRTRQSARSRKQVKTYQGGGGLMNQLRRSYSLSDLSDQPDELKYRAIGMGSLQEEQDVTDQSRGSFQYMRRSYRNPGLRSGSVSGPLEMYFSEMDLDVKRGEKGDRPNTICLPQSMEDVSSGYSSTDHLFSVSQGNSPTSDHALEDVFLRSSGSTHIKSRRPIYSGSIPSSRSSEGVAALVDKLDISMDGEPTYSPFLSHSMLSEIKSLLSSRKGDINEILSSQSRSGNPLYMKVSDSIVTKANQMRSLVDSKENIKKNISKGNEDPIYPNSMCEPSSTLESVVGSESSSLSNTQSDDSQDFKDKAARAGRYKKLRAPVPPSKSTSDPESMLNSEHGTIVKARMSLVSSRRLSGSVNILVESNAGPANNKNTKPTKTQLLSRKLEPRNSSKTHHLMKKKNPLQNNYLSMPNLFSVPSCDKVNQPSAYPQILKITK